MRVLIVTQHFWPESFRINDLAIGLRDRGHDVTVLTGLPNYPEGKIYPGYSFFSKGSVWNDIKVVRVPEIPRGDARKIPMVLNFLSFALFAALLGPFRCRGKFDVIFVFQPTPATVGFPGMVMKWVKKAPVLLWVQDLWPDVLTSTGSINSKKILWLVDRFVRKVYRTSDRILVQSRGFVSHVVSRNISEDRVEFFPNWAESFFRPIELADGAPEFGEMPAGFRILFAGNIGVSQSFETILKAAELTRDQPEIQWVVLGDGRQRKWVEQEVKSRGLSETVHLLGRRSVETMPRYFATADALLCTLTRHPQVSLTIPSKIQSYLATGRPILAALDGEGANVVNESGGGMVCPAENAEGLAEIARKMFARDPEEREEIGQRGRAYFERNFDREFLLDRLEQIMGDVVGAASVDHCETTEESDSTDGKQ